MFTITKEAKINDLKNKLTYWKSDTAQDKYVNGVSVNKDNFATKFGTQPASGGYYYMSDELVGFYDFNTGSCIRIKKMNNSDVTWKSFESLVNVGVTKKSFRTDKPVYREVLNIDNQLWDYIELVSPKNEYGTNFENYVFDWPPLTDGLIPNSNITSADIQECVSFYKEFIDQRNIILPEVLEIAKSNSIGIPVEICNMSSLYKDSAGYFWSELDKSDWSVPVSNVYNSVMGFTMGSTAIALKCGMLTQADADAIISYANTTSNWK
jgi:hypothetical protein